MCLTPKHEEDVVVLRNGKSYIYVFSIFRLPNAKTVGHYAPLQAGAEKCRKEKMKFNIFVRASRRC